MARDAGCRYCVDAHLLLLDLIGADRQVVEAARVDAVGDMPVEPKVRALLEFVQRIDHEAYRITDAQFADLRDVGWSDPELLEAIWTACIFNAIVRLVDTLGLYRLGQLAEAPPAAASPRPAVVTQAADGTPTTSTGEGATHQLNGWAARGRELRLPDAGQRAPTPGWISCCCGGLLRRCFFPGGPPDPPDSV